MTATAPEAPASRGARRALTALAFVGLAVSGLVFLRAGWLLAGTSAYALFGRTVMATVASVERHDVIVRKPRPSRPVARYRGTYRFVAPASDGTPRTWEGRFETADFLGDDRAVAVSDPLPVRYLAWRPAWSRPADSTDADNWLMAALMTVAAGFGGLVSLLLLRMAAALRAARG
jgi:hypothetical protein